jgi:hypothetical protein
MRARTASLPVILDALVLASRLAIFSPHTRSQHTICGYELCGLFLENCMKTGLRSEELQRSKKKVSFPVAKELVGPISLYLLLSFFLAYGLEVFSARCWRWFDIWCIWI